MKQLNVLIMLPNAAACEQTVAAMQQAGIAACGCATPLELFGQLGIGDYDAVVLDIGGLDEIGYALVSRLRTSSMLGIVVLGDSLQVDNRLRCLQSGADACLTSPFDNRELIGVLMALARRLPGRSGDSVAVNGTDVAPAGNAHGNWELRDQNWTLMAPSGVAISLSANERHIVRTLLDATGQAVARDELNKHLDDTASSGRASGSRSIDVIISRLRRKAELAGVILPIRTVYGSGYLFADQ